MASATTPYDPYVPYDSAAASSTGGPSKTQAIQAQIDDTVGIMRDNINKVAQRGERITDLRDKTDNLVVSAQGFRRGANRTRKAMWWKDMKMRICLIGYVYVFISRVQGEERAELEVAIEVHVGSIGIIALILVIILPIIIHFT